MYVIIRERINKKKACKSYYIYSCHGHRKYGYLYSNRKYLGSFSEDVLCDEDKLIELKKNVYINIESKYTNKITIDTLYTNFEQKLNQKILIKNFDKMNSKPNKMKSKKTLTKHIAIIEKPDFTESELQLIVDMLWEIPFLNHEKKGTELFCFIAQTLDKILETDILSHKTRKDKI